MAGLHQTQLTGGIILKKTFFYCINILFTLLQSQNEVWEGHPISPPAGFSLPSWLGLLESLPISKQARCLS